MAASDQQANQMAPPFLSSALVEAVSIATEKVRTVEERGNGAHRGTGAETVDNVDVFRDAGGGATTVCGTQARDSPSAGTARASSGAERPR
ncbi:unnamed protein product [Gadus morhua 'NCC']